jgi:hypothetical protein
MGAADAKSGRLIEGNPRPLPGLGFGQGVNHHAIRAFLSFDLTQLPRNARIVQAVLQCRLAEGRGSPNPKVFDTVLVEAVRIQGSLDAGDFSRDGMLVSRVPIAQLETPLNVTDATVAARRSNAPLVTFRFRFSVDHDSDPTAKTVAFDFSHGVTTLQLTLE